MYHFKLKEFKCQKLNVSKQPSITLLCETKPWQMLERRDALLIKSGRNSYTQHVPCPTVMTIWNNWGHTMWQCRGNITPTAFPLQRLSRQAQVLLNDHHISIYELHYGKGGKTTCIWTLHIFFLRPQISWSSIKMLAVVMKRSFVCWTNARILNLMEFHNCYL